MSFTTADTAVVRRITLALGDSIAHVLEGATSLPPTPSNVVFAITGVDSAGADVPDGTYDLVVRLTDGDGAATDTVSITFDQTPPVFLELALAPASDAYANGDIVSIHANLDEPLDSISVDVSALDTDATNWPTTIVQPLGPVTYGLLYRISLDNTLADMDNRVLRVFARDSLGNGVEDASLRVCLSNAPPLFDSAAILRNGKEVPNGTTFTSGDTVRFVARFQAATGAPAPEDALTYEADLSALDSQFNVLLNPAQIDSTSSAALPESLRFEPEYEFLVSAYLSYTLSEDNARPEGTYPVVLRARDAGCGVAEATPPPRVGLFDLGPDAPVVNVPAGNTTSEATVRITGTVPGAVRVDALDDAGGAIATAEVDTMTTAFGIDVPLAPGPNRFRIVAFDAFNHPSEPSDAIDLFRLTGGATMDLPARYRPGDVITVALTETATRIQLTIYNMAGDRVFAEDATSPAEVYTFTWHGRNESGRDATSGPYIAHVRVSFPSGTQTFNRAFVYTRK